MSRIEEAELTKLYYSIGEVAQMFHVNASLIRFWEKEFTILTPKKNKKGNRLFTSKDILKIDRIYELVKEKGFTLDGAKKALKSKESTDDDEFANVDVIARLEVLRSKLLKIKISSD